MILKAEVRTGADMEFLFRLLPAKVENTLDIFMGKDGVPI
jgi:hypothetical protein